MALADAIADKFEELFSSYRYIPEEMDRSEFYRFLERTKKELILVTGELDETLYAQGRVVNHLRRIVECGGLLKIVGNMGVKTPEAAHETLQEKHPILCSLMKKYPERVQFLWAPKRPNAHYAIGDGVNVLIEGPHPPNGEREVWYFYDDAKLGEEWRGYFQEYLDKVAPQQITCARKAA